ncbi:MAG TPA: hybrid sensor histidine kinase/response regulator [Candidatus Kapabacteria bacterium]|nr:hybrid sensor histidine kinase/response regulator [Candidatus Kapabacteria bacterium]
MQSLYDYKKFAILYVDDEEKSLKYFTRAFQDQFRVFTATNAQDGYALLNQHKDEIGILMTDQRMPGEKGVQLLERARQLRPKIIRMLATAYSDIEAAIDAVNTGAIYKYVHKPWDIPNLEVTLRRALEFFMVQRERDELLKEKLSVLHNLLITDRVVSLGLLAAGLSHHIRNSLVAIRTFLDLAPEKLQEEKVDIEELRDPNFWRDFYDHVQKQLIRITELLTDLGLASNEKPTRFEDVIDLQQFINESLKKITSRAEEKSISIVNNVPSGVKMQVDGYKFSRFFELLLKDEALNLPEGGKVEINGVQEGDDGNRVVKLVIKDNGPGLAPDALRSVFDPFFIRFDNPQEFGINLMACFFIIYHHGGKIEVESERGAGTTFHITLPVNPAEKSLVQNDREFLPQMLSNEALWEKLLAGTV